MAHTADSDATDPRDRIYSLLALANETDRRMVGRPTYQLSVRDVYTNLVRSFIHTYKSLDIICFSQLFRHAGGAKASTEPVLPSWVPDWRVRVETFVTSLMVSQISRHHIGNFRPLKLVDYVRWCAGAYAAAGKRSPQVKLASDFRQLCCRGIFMDVIDGIGGIGSLAKDYKPDPRRLSHLTLIQSSSPVNTSKPQHNSKDTTSAESPSSIYTVDDILRCLVLDREDRYLTYPAIPALFHAGLPHLLNTHRYTRFKDLLLAGGITVDEICRSTVADSTLAAYDYANSEGGEAPISYAGDYDVLTSRVHETSAPDTMARRLMTTAGKGYIGMVPVDAEKGDLVCILFGCSVPVILRASGDHFYRSYTFVGECYLHGFMNGEILEEQNVQEEDFILV